MGSSALGRARAPGADSLFRHGFVCFTNWSSGMNMRSFLAKQYNIYKDQDYDRFQKQRTIGNTPTKDGKGFSVPAQHPDVKIAVHNWNVSQWDIFQRPTVPDFERKGCGPNITTCSQQFCLRVAPPSISSHQVKRFSRCKKKICGTNLHVFFWGVLQKPQSKTSKILHVLTSEMFSGVDCHVGVKTYTPKN